MEDYVEPVSRLLTLDIAEFDEPWFDYSQYGIAVEHVPELIRMMTDMDLNVGESDNSHDDLGPTHAWRALAQMKALEAVDPFLELMNRLEREGPSDWLHEDGPQGFAVIGPLALPYLTRFLKDDQQGKYSRWTAASAIASIAEAHPQVHGEAVTALTAALGTAGGDPAEINAGIIAELVKLKAVDSLSAIEAVYAADCVDEGFVGSLEYVKYGLGLGPKPPPVRRGLINEMNLMTSSGPADQRSQKAKSKAKAKRKMAKASRKRNRR